MKQGKRNAESRMIITNGIFVEYTVGAKNNAKGIEVYVQELSVELMSFLQFTVMILNFRTHRSGQIVQTQIRLLLEEQSDQGLHCLLFHLHVFDKIPSGLASLFEF